MIPLIISTIETPDDRDFMEALYNNYNRLMYKEIRKYIKNDCDVEDILQSVLVKLIDKIQRLRSFDRDQRVNYIIVACRNTALNHLRDSNRASQFTFDEEIDWLDEKYISVDERLERLERMEDVGRAWRTLDERNRCLLEMKYILEMSNEEIAREVGVSTNSVRMLLTRARNRL